MKINFNSNNYKIFNDYKNIMINVFGISCSLCGSTEIFYVLKNSPISIGTLIKEKNRKLTNEEIDNLIEKPLTEWQNFDDKNSKQAIPTFLCSECWNSLLENEV